ncbi:MAG TPA: hypothetical protein DD381_10955 [Lentisphaeria bacterium]|nr:MAG: hypothetical protein A2X47_00645 [Lentisphaerae bacterium GWF2_38_69]HBM16846.1 hypothetical protein [Lentisphaeria bacterium]
MATILAIGISALLLMVGIAFVTTSMIERKSAVNFQDINIARALAQTAFNRAMANMKYKSTDPQENMNEIVSHDADIANDASLTDAEKRAILGDDLASQLTTVINGITYLEIPVDYPSNTAYDISDTSALSWVYIKSPQHQTYTDTQIFGRIAYVVLPDKGKIDPWAVIDSGYNASEYNKNPPSEDNYGGGNSSVASDGSYVSGRPGRDINELCLMSLEYDADSFPPAAEYPTKMSVNTCSQAGLVDTGSAGDWEDYEQLFSTLGITQDNDSIREYFKKVFYVNSTPDDEKYWIDENKDLIKEQGEMQERFNLSRTDWDTLSSQDPNGVAVNAIGNAAKNSQNYLQWLIEWNDPNSTKPQIIANLIDYCDIDDIPTTDSPSVPGYLGLEKVPYINEVMIQFKAVIKRTSTSPYTYDFDVTPTLTVELVNLYDGINSRVYKIYVEPDFSYQFWYGTSTYMFGTSGTDTTTVSFDTPSISSKTYYSISPATPLQVGLNDTKTKGTNINVNNVKTLRIKMAVTVKSLKIKLMSTDGNTLYDYSEMPTMLVTPETPFFTVNGTSNTTNTAYITLDYQVKDPRQNLKQEDWISTPGTSTANLNQTSSQTAANATIGSVNTSYTLARSIFNGTTYDLETATDPTGISTAFIRNAPMKSPWELGFIHRAKAFQTLNLKKYNEAADGNGFGPSAGGGTYILGDANILDQVKMTSNSATLGKINLNSDNVSVLRTLFDQIKIGSNIKSSTGNDPASGGSAISVSTANTIAQEVLDQNGTTGGSPFVTRAQIVNEVSELTTQSGQTTDASKEELIGKFINLTKVETPDLYTIIAVGQTLKDIGPDEGTASIYKSNQEVNVKKGRFDINADEVTSSQKILARVKYDETHPDSFYIQDIMYLED